MSGRIFAFMTASMTNMETGAEGNGWIDRDWSMTMLHDSRNDVHPLVNVDEIDVETLTDEIRDVLGDGSMWHDNGDGTFYAADCRDVNGECWTYAVYFVRKAYGDRGYFESPWHPVRDGGISLSERANG